MSCLRAYHLSGLRDMNLKYRRKLRRNYHHQFSNITFELNLVFPEIP